MCCALPQVLVESLQQERSRLDLRVRALEHELESVRSQLEAIQSER